MQTQNNQSEGARLKTAIQVEYESSRQGLHGLSEAGRHQFITARQTSIAKHNLALCEFADETTMLEIFAKLGE